MDENREFIINQEIENDTEVELLYEYFPNDFFFFVLQNVLEAENMFQEVDDRRLQEESNIFLLAYELKHMNTTLLEHQLKLLDIEQKRLKRDLKCCLEDFKKIAHEFQKGSNHEENDECTHLQEKLISLTITCIELEEIIGNVQSSTTDVETLLNEVQEDIFKYQEAYQECLSYLKKFLHKAKKIEISNVPRDCQEKLCVIFSLLEVNIPTYNTILISANDHFESLQSAIENDLDSSDQDLDNRLSCFIKTIGKADLAFSNLNLLLFDAIQFDCVLHENY